MAKSTVTVWLEAALNETVKRRAAAVSFSVVKLAIDKVGAASSSVIVNTPVESFNVTSEGLLSVTVTVSFTSSTASARTAIGIF